MPPKKKKFVACRCLQQGQVRLRNGHIRTCYPGDTGIVIEESTIPWYMEKMTAENVKARKKDGTLDFEKATEAQLKKEAFDLVDLVDFIKSRFDPEFDLHPDIGKTPLIEALLEYRLLDMG